MFIKVTPTLMGNFCVIFCMKRLWLILLLCISFLLGQTINIITSEDLSSGSFQTVTEVLHGRVPGLVGANMGGQGGAARIRLRGTVSLTQRNQPLIYIDGVRIDNSMTDNASISTSRLNDIDVNTIDRIEVIKGAAAATLFGTDAASGVIQIFTKRGTVSKPS